MDRVSTRFGGTKPIGAEVSIPRSGWIVFQLDCAVNLIYRSKVSIPRSGWIVFQQSVEMQQSSRKLFQSLVRDGSCFNE